ncbi:ABC transporter substrate-binding protein [Lacrimispora saccharolytica]|uniref:ABC transporter substrate-binding protein n=1 Tax=Lacrimispora saccharolytica TaxID=84030 RepID=UPI001B7B680E|nr:ABC transporter substrate-binding protein [Lacrimispora saccharolytica]MBP9000550.1 ABC transporter substrate-binding protein [Lachnospiraceae bacterium]MCF2655766.1 ABC transporter substrate-binding protein [Lacrimispora saccharolytica]MCI7557713.1 ABC transporter substrate-binding protein [Lachnospiraceae bacterium]MDD7547631.1 ABC transporter substrate-binding protein [Lachnospiraceae bacterium]
MKKKMLSMVLAMAMALSLTACGSNEAADASSEYVVGICNYVDDASLNQICDNIQNRLAEIGTEKGVTFTVKYDNCMADANVMEQIISDFIADDVDLMVGVATPVAMAMQADTEDNQIPVIFAAVSDPLATGVVESLEAPGANVTGTSDFLDTTAVMNLIFAANPEADKIGLLYDLGQDASTTAINDAKAYLDAKNIEYVERTGTTVDEVSLAADALIADEVDAIFTPSDNTIMQAELTIYEKLADAGIPHYTGADSFALNGAFLGYGVDYANLGVETANMIAEVLLDGKEPATLPVKTFDNGTATINTEVCEKLGLDYATISETFAPYCTQVKEIQTAESFE